MTRGSTGRRGRPRGGRSARPSTRQAAADAPAASSGSDAAAPSLDTPASAPISSSDSAPAAPVAQMAPVPSSSSRGSISSRAPRFRPKNVRRNEADRARIAEEEAQKESERLAAERRQKGRFTYRGRRGARGNRPGATQTRGNARRDGMDVVKPESDATTSNARTSGGRRYQNGATSSGNSNTSATPAVATPSATESLSIPGYEDVVLINGDLFHKPLWDSRDLTEEERSIVDYLKSLPGPLPMGLGREQYYEADGDGNDGLTRAERSKKFKEEHSDYLLECFTQGLDNGESKPFLFAMPPTANIPLLRPSAPSQQIKDESDDHGMQDIGTGTGTALSEDEDAAPAVDKDDEIDQYYNNYGGAPRFQHGGHVGKLRIHKSGKAVLDWGGLEMELYKGGEVGGTLSYMVIEDDESKDPDRGPTGRAISMGQLLGEIGACTLDVNSDKDGEDKLSLGEDALNKMMEEALAKGLV